MSAYRTIAVASVYALANIGLCWLHDDSMRFLVRCIVSVALVPASILIWRSIVVYTARQLTKAEPVFDSILREVVDS